MKRNWVKMFLVGLTIVSLILAVILYGAMPERMVTHWGLYGEPNGWMSRFWGMAIWPAINLFMLFIYFFVPKFEPKKENLADFRKEYDKLMLWIFLVLNYIFVLSFIYNRGVAIDMGRMTVPVFGLLYIAMGMILPKTKQNFMVGIRTPWTLADDKVWKMTHEFGGKLFVASGVVTVFTGLLSTMWGFVALFGSVLITTLLVMVYSWREYHLVAKK
jgi:uncharacterized membrane protein